MDKDLNVHSKESRSPATGDITSLILTGFVPWPEDCEECVQFSTESFSEKSGSKLVRTVWIDPMQESKAVLIDAYRASSNIQAQKYLASLATSCMIRPSLVDSVDSIHQFGMRAENVPEYSSDVRGNICLAVSRLRTSNVDAAIWKNRLNARILEMPKTDQLSLSIKRLKLEVHVHDKVLINYSLPWQLGDTGYFKFFAFGGQLCLEMERLYFNAEAPGEHLIVGFAVESGHQSYRGELAIDVKPQSIS